MRAVGLAAAGACLFMSSAVHADELRAVTQARFEARYLRLMEAPKPPFDDQVVGGLALRPTVGLEHVQYAIGLDFHLGGTSPAGFAYDAHIRPLGFAFDDDGLRWSSTFGIGVDGVTGALDPAMRLPVDALLEMPMGEDVKLELGLELAWLPVAEARQDGARAVTIADESALSLRLRFDRRYQRRWRGANGVLLSLELAERHRGLLIGTAVGYSFDGAWRL